MARLIYSSIASLDGYVEDADGKFDWAAPDEEVHAVVNDQERQIGSYLYGRGMYETMVAWETMETAGHADVMRDYAEIWQAAEKIVYSSELEEVSSARTRIERDFDPVAIRELKAATDQDISVGGANLAGQALAAGLVDECQLFLTPIAVGAGKSVFPAGVRAELELLDQRRFDNGTVYLRYAVRG